MLFLQSQDILQLKLSTTRKNNLLFQSRITKNSQQLLEYLSQNNRQQTLKLTIRTKTVSNAMLSQLDWQIIYLLVTAQLLEQ